MKTDKRISEESIESLDEMFRYCFLIVGLREKSFPNPLETMFLHQFIRENYGGHSVEEVKMAFRMAIKSELDLKSDDVKTYENFSAIYLSNILNSYRRWASDEFRRLEKHIPVNPDEVKRLEGPKQELHWGSIIEKEYQHFLSFGEERWKLYSVGMYDQLVTDKIYEENIFRSVMPVVRKLFISELQKDLAVLTMRRFSDEEDEKVKYAKNSNTLKIKNSEKIIEDYRSGEKNSELETAAKQYCILQFFKNAKEKMKQHVYVPVEEK